MAATVTLVSGTAVEVMSVEEKTFFEMTRDRYLGEHTFTAITDMQDLDRLLALELMVHRWTRWMASGRDYYGNLVDEVDLRRGMKDYSAQITSVKQSMGLAKSERDKDAHDSVGSYIIALKQAGKQFGVHRSNQAAKAIALMMEAMSLCGTYARSNALERGKLGITAEDIIDWVNTVAGPEMLELDRAFRQNQQKYWTVK